MMVKLENEIAFKLVKIITEQFAIFEENQILVNDIQIKTEIKFGFDKNRRLISVIPNFTFLSNKASFLKIVVSCHFQIKEDAWESFHIIDEDKFVIPALLLKHLSVITVGTARGVLHSKTENSDYNKYFLPTINIEELIKEDLVVTLENS